MTRNFYIRWIKAAHLGRHRGEHDALRCAVRTGQFLREVKQQNPGEFLNWIEGERLRLGFGVREAQRYMRIAAYCAANGIKVSRPRTVRHTVTHLTTLRAVLAEVEKGSWRQPPPRPKRYVVPIPCKDREDRDRLVELLRQAWAHGGYEAPFEALTMYNWTKEGA